MCQCLFTSVRIHLHSILSSILYFAPILEAVLFSFSILMECSQLDESVNGALFNQSVKLNQYAIFSPLIL